MSDIDLETAQIMASNLAGLMGREIIILDLTDGEVTVHQHSATSVMPQSTYGTRRAAAARLLQLLAVGPVGPQTWPETAEIVVETPHDRS